MCFIRNFGETRTTEIARFKFDIVCDFLRGRSVSVWVCDLSFRFDVSSELWTLIPSINMLRSTRDRQPLMIGLHRLWFLPISFTIKNMSFHYGRRVFLWADIAWFHYLGFSVNNVMSEIEGVCERVSLSNWERDSFYYLVWSELFGCLAFSSMSEEFIRLHKHSALFTRLPPIIITEIAFENFTRFWRFGPFWSFGLSLWSSSWGTNLFDRFRRSVWSTRALMNEKRVWKKRSRAVFTRYEVARLFSNLGLRLCFWSCWLFTFWLRWRVAENHFSARFKMCLQTRWFECSWADLTRD